MTIALIDASIDCENARFDLSTLALIAAGNRRLTQPAIKPVRDIPQHLLWRDS
jgi:hypothetical protein